MDGLCNKHKAYKKRLTFQSDSTTLLSYQQYVKDLNFLAVFFFPQGIYFLYCPIISILLFGVNAIFLK